MRGDFRKVILFGKVIFLKFVCNETFPARRNAWESFFILLNNNLMHFIEA